MTVETLALIASYFLCSVAAEERVLVGPEIDACIVRYTEVKLQFVDGVDMSDYQALTAVERAVVNQAGYAGYVGWMAANAELVDQMKAAARQQLLEGVRL